MININLLILLALLILYKFLAVEIYQLIMVNYSKMMSGFIILIRETLEYLNVTYLSDSSFGV